MVYIVWLSDIRNKGGHYIMSCGFRSVHVGACFLDSWMKLNDLRSWLLPLSYGALYMAQKSLTIVLPWQVHSFTTAIRALYCYQEHSHGPCFYTSNNHWPLLYVLCCIFFSWICFHQIQLPFLLDLISHNCFLCSPEPHPCKIETTCFEFSHLGCTPHLWPLTVLSSLS